jgi:hypothetical protein
MHCEWDTVTATTVVGRAEGRTHTHSTVDRAGRTNNAAQFACN